MAPWHDWVEDKVKNGLSLGPKKSYYDLLPQRNPQYPFDQAVRDQAPRFHVAPFYNPPNPTQAIDRAWGEEGPKPSAITPQALLGLDPQGLRSSLSSGGSRFNQAGRQAIQGFAPPQAVNTANPLDVARQTLGIPNPRAINLDDEMARIGALPSQTMGAPPLQAIETRPQANQGGGGGPLPAVPPTNGAIAPPPTNAAIPQVANELNRWDMARGLRNAGIEIPQMNRAEMIAALTPKPGQPGLANVGTMTDDQLRDLMDRKGMNYFKVNDDQMRGLWQPIEQKNIQNRPQALFTGGDFGANPPASYDQAINTALQMFMNYAKNPSLGPHYLQGAITALQHLPVSKEYPESAAAEREYKRGSAEYSRAHAGLVPSEIEKNQAVTRNYNKAAKTSAIPVGPGVGLFVPGENPAQPWNKVAEGTQEKPGVHGATEHMTEGDKVMLTGAWHALGSEMDPENRKMYQGVIDSIYGKYTGGGAGMKPPVAGATLRKDPSTGKPVWVDPTGKVIQPSAQ